MADERVISVPVPPQQGAPNCSTPKAEANKVIALGAAVGVAGGLAGLVVGAVCPLCFIVAPGLIGAGVVARVRAANSRPSGEASNDEPESIQNNPSEKPSKRDG